MRHNPRKRFGQNFLHDRSVIAHILASAQINKGEHWLEIGPGLGALTEPLLNSGVKLDVLELDRDLVAYLQNKFAQQSNLTIHSGDALRFDYASLIHSATEKLRVIGNLPYNISTPLMFHLLESAGMIADMHFMLQKELVDRICAPPGNKQYGRLSVMMQYHCATEWLFDVPPESFDPAPKVTSAIIRLTPYSKPPVVVNDVKKLNRLVTEAFSQRRKTLRNALKNLISEPQWLAAQINPSARAETLALSDFAKLSNLL